MGLTIEFAGVSTFVWNKDRNSAEAVLVDLGASGFHKHHATLATEGAPGLSCPDPDISVAVPGSPLELGIWTLNGELAVSADAAPLDVDDGAIEHGNPPSHQNGSIRWLPEIGAICQSRTLASKVPVAARLPLTIGRVSSTAAAHPPMRVAFDVADEGLGEERYVLPRFMVEIDAPAVTLRLDAKRELRFANDHHVIISNTCVCEPAGAAGAGHFYGHYLLVDAKRKPAVRRTSGPFLRPKTFAIPSAPEHCFSAYLEI